LLIHSELFALIDSHLFLALEAPQLHQNTSFAAQLRFANCPAPMPQLRAVHVAVNRSAREEDIQMHAQWRVPNQSIIFRAFEQGTDMEVLENLDWWKTTGGSQLRSCPVFVRAKYSPETVTALLIPQL